MDCEKFESTLIDELYDELDELTSAAAKRHVAGCARCASLLSGLKATRRVAVLPILEPPADLEDRILAAARDAQKVVPMKRRVSNAISWAGSWAMRPQTAMAALFLLMIGSSALFLRGRSAKAPASANMTVSAEGAPAPSTATAAIARPADLEAESAHGVPGAPRPPEPVAAAPPSLGLLPTTPAATAAPSGFIPNSNSQPFASLSKSAAGSARARADKDDSADIALNDSRLSAEFSRNESASASNAGAVAGAGPSQGYAYNTPATAPAAAAPAPPPAAKQPDYDGREQQAQVQAQKKGGPSDFEDGMAQYKARKYAEATRLFDSAAKAGDSQALVAALYAARSVEAQGGCSAAIGRYEELGTRAFGTPAGYDATLDAGRCYRILGDGERARARLNRLLTVTTHSRLAQTELDALAPKAAAKPAARAAPKAAPSKPVTTDQAY